MHWDVCEGEGPSASLSQWAEVALEWLGRWRQRWYSEQEAVMQGSNDPRHDFHANPTVDELIAQQRKEPIRDPQIFLGDLWPEDEPTEDFLTCRAQSGACDRMRRRLDRRHDTAV
jgi:hypothetical protein